MDAATFLAALQLADSSLPTGRFAHSAGLEALLDRGSLSERELAELAESHACEGVAPLDGVVAGYAARALALDDLLELDRLLGAHKLVPGARTASLRCGRQLARLTGDLTSDALALALAEAVRDGRAGGHLAVVEATLARAAGLDAEGTVLLALRGAASAALSAAVRLGLVSARSAQRLLAAMSDALARACARALATPLERLHSSTPELDLLGLAHPRADARSFAT